LEKSHVNAQVLSISPEERQEIEAAATPLVTAARACVVKTNADYLRAGDQLKAIKSAQKLLAAKKKKLLDPLKAAVKAANELFSAPELELDEAEGLYKRTMIAFVDEQDRLRREEQARLDKVAEDDRRKKEEQAKKALAAAEEARLAGNEKKAEKLEAKAEVLTDTAAEIVPAMVQRAPPRASGISAAEYWSAVVLNFEDLVLAVAAEIIRKRRGPDETDAELLYRILQGPSVPITAIAPNEKVLNSMARSLKKELNWPGVRAVVDKGIRAGSR